ncbi:MAG: hypothetical protein RL685_7356 [Pseudomonadota bacterium]
MLLAGSAACNSASSGLLDQPGAIPRTAGQTGDEGVKPWRPGGGTGDSECPLNETAQALASLEEDTELGFSAADILTFVAGSQEARVHWNAAPLTLFTSFEVQVTPGNLDETLRLTLAHDGSAPRYRSRLLPPYDAPACRGQIELGVTVELRTESGALEEQWSGTLKAADASEAVILLGAPTWRGRLPRQPDRDEGYFLNAQEGTLAVIDAADPGSKLAWVDVLLRFRTGAIDGSVNGWVQTAAGGAFVLPQLSDSRDAAGWIGVIGEGFYENIWATE